MVFSGKSLGQEKGYKATGIIFIRGNRGLTLYGKGEDGQMMKDTKMSPFYLPMRKSIVHRTYCPHWDLVGKRQAFLLFSYPHILAACFPVRSPVVLMGPWRSAH